MSVPAAASCLALMATVHAAGKRGVARPRWSADHPVAKGAGLLQYDAHSASSNAQFAYNRALMEIKAVMGKEDVWQRRRHRRFGVVNVVE